MADLVIAGTNVTKLIAGGLSGVLPLLRIEIDGIDYIANGMVELEADGTATVTLIHGTGTLTGDIRPREGSIVTWDRKQYHVEDVGGTREVAWTLTCGQPITETEVDEPTIRITACGRALILTRTDVLDGTIYANYKETTQLDYGSVLSYGQRVAIIVDGIKANTSYDVVAWLILKDGTRTQSVNATVTTGS